MSVWSTRCGSGDPRSEGQCPPAAQFSHDGQRIVTASEDGTARIWNARNGAQLTPPLRHKALVNNACFSPNGQWVATGSRDTTARLWDARTGEAVSEPLRHRGSVGACFSPDDLRVITASTDGSARIWDARTGRPLTEAFQHAGPVGVLFSHDARRVATTSYDGTVRIWELPPNVAASGMSAAATLAHLAEAVIGQRLGESGTLEPVSSHRLVELRQHPPTRTSTNEFTRWLAWFLADRSTRTISPNSPITTPECVERMMERKTLDAAREAVLLAPTNAVALGHLAEMLLTSPGSNAPVTVSEARFLRHRAEMLSTGARPARPGEQ